MHNACKRDKCTHIAVVDFYKSYENPRISIIPHDEFFASNVTAAKVSDITFTTNSDAAASQVPTTN